MCRAPDRGHRFEGSVLAAALLVAVASCQVARDPQVDPVATERSSLRADLPTFEPGTRREQVRAALADWPGPRRLGVAETIESFEWSGPDGMRVEAAFAGDVARAMSVSRTWGSGAPPVEADRLPSVRTGVTSAELESAIGPGLVVERSWATEPFGDGSISERCVWAIHDRGIDTGLFLTVHARNGRVTAFAHRWGRS